MEDIEVPSDGTEDAPVSPEPEESSAPEESAASEEKPEAEPDDQDTGDKGEEAAPEQGHGGAFDKLLAKYGGDKEKMAAAYFEQANSSSRLWEKLQGIEEYIKGQQKQPEVNEAQLVAEDPDIKQIVKDYSDAQSEITETKQRQDQLIAKFGDLERKIAKEQGKLEAAPDYETKSEIRAQLADLTSELKSVHADIRGTQSDMKRLNKDLVSLARQYREAESRAKDKVSRQRQEQYERQQEAVATRQEFADSMRTEAGKYGIKLDSKQYAVLFSSINDRIYSYLNRLPEGAPGIDIPGAVQYLMAEYADTMGMKAQFGKASEAKRAAAGAPTARPPEAKGPAPTVPQPKNGQWTKAYVEERAKRLLG
jgi:predicted  nucleic acid-binding Zn-ribbon protein